MFQDAFKIDEPYTGVVRTNIIMDREIIDSFELEIEAMDKGSPPLTSRCMLRVRVVDANNNAPFFPSYQPISIPEGTTISLNSSELQFEIFCIFSRAFSIISRQLSIILFFSGTPLGKQILQVTANDQDLNPLLMYDFTSDGNPGDTFRIDRYSGRILVKRELDYELQRTFDLRIKVSYLLHMLRAVQKSADTFETLKNNG